MKIHTAHVITELKKAVADERRALTRVLTLLHRVDDERLFLNLGLPSLFDFCVKELGYSNDAAQRRISAMRLMKSVPEVIEKLEEGSLSLAVVAEAARVIRIEDEVRKEQRLQRVSPQEKRDMVLSLTSKSRKAATQELISKVSTAAAERISTGLEVKLRLTADQERKLTQLRALLSNRPGAQSLEGLLNILMDEALERHDPQRVAARIEKRKQRVSTALSAAAKPTDSAASATLNAAAKPTDSAVSTALNAAVKPTISAAGATSADEVNLAELVGYTSIAAGEKSTPRSPATFRSHAQTRFISAEIKRQVWLRDGGKCTFHGCGSTQYIHFDHHVPHALGGACEAFDPPLRLG